MLTHLLDQTKPAKTQRHTHKHSCWLQFRGHTQEPTLLRRTGDKLSFSGKTQRLQEMELQVCRDLQLVLTEGPGSLWSKSQTGDDHISPRTVPSWGDQTSFILL